MKVRRNNRVKQEPQAEKEVQVKHEPRAKQEPQVEQKTDRRMTRSQGRSFSSLSHHVAFKEEENKSTKIVLSKLSTTSEIPYVH